MATILYGIRVMAQERVKIIAHRGNSSQYPESTTASFVSAFSLDIYGVEFDLRLTKDKEWIIWHDEDLFGKVIHRSTKEELKQIDCSSYFSNTTLPSPPIFFKEFLEIPRNGKHMMIEVKIEHYTDRKKALEILIKDMGSISKSSFHVASFDSEFLLLAQREGLPVMPIVENLAALSDFPTLDSPVAISYHFLNYKDLLELRKKREVWLWTVDAPSLARHYISIGIDGVITNDPKSIQAIEKSPF